MRRSSRRAAAALAIFAAVAALAAGCGSPLSATDATNTAQAGVGAPGTPAVTPITGTPATSAAAATATALFDNINRKRFGNEPTFAPGTDPLHPYASVTYPPEPTNTPGPSPTPLSPSCGATIAGWDDIVAKYGGFYMGNGCGVYDGQLVISTAGVNGGPGAIATYQCQPTDSSCLRGNAPDAPGASWSVYPSPYPGVVSIRGFSAPDRLLILPGEYCFNLSTHTYNTSHDCWTP
jgi:hypothetical protein